LRQRCSGVLVAEPFRAEEDDRNADEGGGGGGRALLRRCPESAGYCCEIQDPTSTYVFLLSRQPLVPNQVLPAVASLPVPWGAAAAADAADAAPKSVGGEIAFMSTVREELSSPLLHSSTKDGKPFSPGTSESTPNVYEILNSQGALPNQVPNRQACMDCLREKKASDCVICAEKCGAFCEKVCKVEVREKPVKRVVSVEGPRYRKDPERIIPRIVHQVSERAEGRRGDDMPRGREDCCSPIFFYHRLFLFPTRGTIASSFVLFSSFQQTWFEPVTPDKYPNMSRLIESWKRSGWEYHFWDDASAADFLSLHFPPEVREAYESIIPGAFKADLFRYCVLLIMGGIYSDMDVMLESNLDAAVPPDVGFMVPVDAPGIRPDKRMCLWNGFIASAPAHPFLVRVIDHVVNNIRNRFTVVDYDRMMCPMPETSVVHAFSTLFTAGPCILGLTVNEVMGRGLQETFVEGDLVGPEEGGSGMGVPGRTIILKQNKWDMGGECVARITPRKHRSTIFDSPFWSRIGIISPMDNPFRSAILPQNAAHRFTWDENNLVIAGEFELLFSRSCVFVFSQCNARSHCLPHRVTTDAQQPPTCPITTTGRNSRESRRSRLLTTARRSIATVCTGRGRCTLTGT
jgi:hypothetical protein